jgi:feruloyl-CoA synthase
MHPPPALDSTAAIFFTSGSTGDAKGVINTHRMFSANQQAIAALWPFLGVRRPVLLDWLPWHHTFGGNDNFNKILWNGGTLHIDQGRPEPAAIHETIANLREVAPSLHINVPRGLELLIPLLESDATFRTRFFSRLDLIFFAGAALPLPLCERLRRLVFDAETAQGRPIGMVSGWGTTEAGSTICLGYFKTERPDNLGLPLPGFSLKLVPVENRLEARVRGPNVTPGYWRRPDLTAAAFDEEGYYRTGDAVRFADPARPEAGLLFDGRLAEDFKLTNGSWVQVGKLRTDLLAACAPLLRDIAIAGIGRDEIGLLAFLNPDGCRPLRTGSASDAPPAAMAAWREVHAALRRGIEAYNRDNPNATRRVGRMILMDDAPSPERGEINDKAYLNQRTTLANRSDAVDMLYSDGQAPTKLLFPK